MVCALKTLEEKSVLHESFRKLKKTSQEFSKIKGATIIRDLLFRRKTTNSIITWIEAVYANEDFSIESLRLEKLRRAFQIGFWSQKKDDVLVLRAFKDWKRLDY